MRATGLLFLVGCTSLRGSSSAEESYAEYTAALARSSAEQEQLSRANTERAKAEAARVAAERQKEVEATRVAFNARAAEGLAEREREEAASDWLKRAPAQCRLELNHRACSVAPEGTSEERRQSCATKCRDAIMAGIEARLDAMVATCAESKGPAECADGLPASADPNGLAGPAITPAGFAAFKALCSKRCSETRAYAGKVATQTPLAEKQGPALVESYKRCMMAVDSTLAARREEAYDRDLYEKRMQSADARCRAQHRCDWLEEFSSFECVYGN